MLRAFAPEADEVKAKFLDRTKFFDPGANWSGVECPLCGADAEAWWGEAMGDAYDGQFRDLAVTAPCCGGLTSLNELVYGWPAAFGRFVLEAINPNISDVTPDQERQLAEVLGLELRKVLKHM